MPTVDALVFDAYGTLFDVHSVAALAEALAPGRGADAVAAVAREAARIHVAREPDGRARPCRARTSPRSPRRRSTTRWRRSRSTLDAAARKRRLRDAYLTPRAVPRRRARRWRALAPRPRWILSNGTLAMLEPLVAARRARAAARRRAVGRRRRHLQAEPARLRSSRPTRCGCRRARIGFVSSNGWDADRRARPSGSRRSGSTAPARRSTATVRAGPHHRLARRAAVAAAPHGAERSPATAAHRALRACTGRR